MGLRERGTCVETEPPISRDAFLFRGTTHSPTFVKLSSKIFRFSMTARARKEEGQSMDAASYLGAIRGKFVAYRRLSFRFQQAISDQVVPCP